MLLLSNHRFLGNRRRLHKGCRFSENKGFEKVFNRALIDQTLDRAIHRISIRETDCNNRWILIYPLDRVIHLLNNWGQKVVALWYILWHILVFNKRRTFLNISWKTNVRFSQLSIVCCFLSAVIFTGATEANPNMVLVFLSLNFSQD